MKENTTGQKEIKELITKGKKQGYLTYEEVNDALPDELMSSADQLDDVVGMFGEMDIEIIDSDRRIQIKDVKGKDSEEDEDDSEDEDAEAPVKAVAAAKAAPGALTGRTDDPVRLYLKEMGQINLLTREGEVEIAKRIEKGELEVLETVSCNAICIRDLIVLGEKLESGDVKLRESLFDTEETVEEDENEESDTDANGEGNGEDQDEAAREALAEANRQSLLLREAENLKEVLRTIKRIERRVERIEQLDKEAGKASKKKAEQIEKRIQRAEKDNARDIRNLGLNTRQVARFSARITALREKILLYQGRIDNIYRRTSLTEWRMGQLVKKARDGGAKSAAREAGMSIAQLESYRQLVRDARKKLKEIEKEAAIPCGTIVVDGEKIRLAEIRARDAKQELVEANLRLVVSIA